MATYDIHYQLLPAEEMPAEDGRIFTFGFESAVGVKGPQKLANRWLKCFFTPKGTDLSDANYGTGFPSLLGSNISQQQEFTDAVALYVSDCNEQIRAFDLAQMPPLNERLASATLSSVVPRGNDGYDAYVTLKNAAGEVITTWIPSGTMRP